MEPHAILARLAEARQMAFDGDPHQLADYLDRLMADIPVPVCVRQLYERSGCKGKRRWMQQAFPGLPKSRQNQLYRYMTGETGMHVGYEALLRGPNIVALVNQKGKRLWTASLASEPSAGGGTQAGQQPGGQGLHAPASQVPAQPLAGAQPT